MALDLDQSSGFNEIGVATNVTETHGNIGPPLAANTTFAMTFWAQDVANDGSDLRTVIWNTDKLPTSGDGQWITMKGAQGGSRFMIKRTSSYQITVRRAGGVDAVNEVTLYLP